MLQAKIKYLLLPKSLSLPNPSKPPSITPFSTKVFLHTSNQIKRLANTDSLTIEKYNRKSYGRRLAAEYAKPIADRDSVRVAELEEQSNTLEKELVRTVAGFGKHFGKCAGRMSRALFSPAKQPSNLYTISSIIPIRRIV